ncbi:LysR family transcriptional regulator [Rhizobium sp. M1]|uniref:LysR family transcriptional regulator n=1 Tax=Rhizobium sp. M1 TaxID=2035453 RepID=UPI000BE93856|nr:LysR family transcriptional regulator [Rhizobium sp. M1]PDT08299.1 LysR family transcriptional regulator [Rhizobium sp. M1]
MNFSALDLNLLRVFDAMMSELSTVRAGERVGLSQPAVSSALGRLRALLDDELFVREGNQMMPTARALELRQPIRQALAGMEEALATSAVFDPATSTRSFMLIGSDYFSTLLMPPLAARVAEAAPSVTLQMVDHASSEVFEVLRDGRADIVIDRSLEPPEWVASRKVLQSWLVCIAKQGHPLLASRGLHPGDVIPADLFCAVPHVLRSADGSRTGTIDPALARLGLARRVMVTVPHFHAVALAVESSEMLGSIPVHFARTLIGRLKLDVFMPPMESPKMDVTMYWLRRFDADPGSAWLRSEIAQTLAAPEPPLFPSSPEPDRPED